MSPNPASRRLPAGVPDEPLELLPGDAVVAVAMSGGVDSSVAAARLRGAGFSCLGITLAMWPRDAERDRDRGCCSVDAVEDARRVAAALGMPHYVWNLEEDFTAAVVADFEAEYAAGRTPNPCVRCNERIKLGVLLERARAVGASHLATGHHARLGRRAGQPTLHRGLALGKDQSYSLHRVPAAALGLTVLPLGGLPSKAAVRAEAAARKLVTAAKPESQELCFVDGDLRGELERRLRGRFGPGEVVDEAGRVLGEHPGLPFFTVGQRSGLGLAPRRPDARPLHVLRLEASANRVVVGPRERLARAEVVAEACAWIAGPPRCGDELGLQLRANGSAAPARVVAVEEGGGRLRLRLAVPALGVAPGQSAVLYDGDEALGGGLVAAAA